MASLQRLIRQSTNIDLPSTAKARDELFNRLVQDEDLLRDVRDGISLLQDAYKAIAATQEFRKKPDEYSPNILITYDFLLLVGKLRQFFPEEMMKELRRSPANRLTTNKRGLGFGEGPSKRQKLGANVFGAGGGVKRSREDDSEDDDSLEGPSKQQKWGASVFGAGARVKRSREDDDSEDDDSEDDDSEDDDSFKGPSKQQKWGANGFGFDGTRVKEEPQD